jgi:class 3 adenylate cyclase
MPYDFPLSRKWNPRKYNELKNFIKMTMDRSSRISKVIPNARAMPSLESINIGSSKRMTAAILFFDFKDFTSITSKILPEDTLAILNATTTVVMRIVKEWGGVVEKHTGDGVMAIIGTSRKAHSEIAKDAVEVAMTIKYVMKNDVMPYLFKEGYPVLSFRIGIDMGEVLIARIGYNNNSFLTAVGSPANRAAKLESLAMDNKVVLGDNLAKNLHIALHPYLKLGNDEHWNWLYEGTNTPYNYYHYNYEWLEPIEWLKTINEYMRTNK